MKKPETKINEIMEKSKGYLNTASHYAKTALVYGFIIVEELAWNKVGEPVYHAVEQLKIMDRFKAWVSSVEHRYALLAIFLSVFVLMELSSTYGLILIGTGALFTGIGLYAMKLFLTVPAVIIFNAGKKPLLSFWVIKFVYSLILKLRRSAIFRNAKKQLATIREGAVRFKEEYLNGDGTVGFKDSIKAIYNDLKTK